MEVCPLVKLANNLKIKRKFEKTGHVLIPGSEYIRFFEALAFLAGNGEYVEVYCVIAGDDLILSKTPFKRPTETEPAQERLFER